MKIQIDQVTSPPNSEAQSQPVFSSADMLKPDEVPAGIGRILVVEDDPIFLEMTVHLLRSENYSCDCATNGFDAAKLLAAKPYDLLISDLEMPGNQDLQLIREVPQIRSGMPVILMTAFPTLDSAIRSVQLPVVAYLVKPIEKADLLERVKTAVRNHRALCTVRSCRRRVEEWDRRLQSIAASLESSRQPAPAAWHTLVDLTLRNATDALTDARIFADLACGEGGSEPSPEVLNSTRPMLLLNALYETLVVLEKTKSAFKSRDLAELRKKLMPLLVSKPTPSQKNPKD